MLARFYRHRAARLLGLVILTLPVLVFQGESLESNNDIETWLPSEAPVRAVYDGFKERFGAEELIVVALPTDVVDEQRVEAVCRRLERLDGIRRCWSPERLVGLMTDLGVDPDQARSRLEGLAVSADQQLVGLALLLSPGGLADRAGTVAAVREELRYCRLAPHIANLGGAPVVVAELDRLGSREHNKQFFLITLVVCLGLLYYVLRDWRLTLGILGLTIWSINLTLSMLGWAGQEMNFILGALPVMVMVFTLAVSVHLVHYYRAAIDSDDPLDEALRMAWKPCCLATLTTAIGLVSLCISDIGPVRQFGWAGAVGAVVALVTGLGLTPAVLALFPPRRLAEPTRDKSARWLRLSSLPTRIIGRCGLVTAGTLLLLAAAGSGLPRLKARIEPLDFLPREGRVRQDVDRIETELTGTTTIEAVVDFGDLPLPFVEKLERVRELERLIRRHPGVRHSMSLATFFPEQMPDDPFETLKLLDRARKSPGGKDYIAAGERLWRISARLRTDAGVSRAQTFEELAAATLGQPITWTGIAPLLDDAQQRIFTGFVESFLTAFAIITVVMIVSLRSLRSGLLAMLPNLTPIVIVFGVLGWGGWTIDIGMMMSGSIALGIAVDGTFHFLVRYHERRRSESGPAAAESALRKTAPPILQAAIIAGAGMLALTLSPFNPTARFGALTAAMLATALLGDLVLLPALLSLGRSRQPNKPRRRPHFLEIDFHRRARRPAAANVDRSGRRRATGA